MSLSIWTQHLTVGCFILTYKKYNFFSAPYGTLSKIWSKIVSTHTSCLWSTPWGPFPCSGLPPPVPNPTLSAPDSSLFPGTALFKLYPWQSQPKASPSLRQHKPMATGCIRSGTHMCHVIPPALLRVTQSCSVLLIRFDLLIHPRLWISDNQEFKIYHLGAKPEFGCQTQLWVFWQERSFPTIRFASWVTQFQTNGV